MIGREGRRECHAQNGPAPECKRAAPSPRRSRTRTGMPAVTARAPGAGRRPAPRRATRPDRCSPRFSGAAYASTLLRVMVLLAVLFHTVAPAGAHPMGNFSINHYAAIQSDGRRLIVRYVLDMAEIPTVTELRAMDADRDGRVSAAGREGYAKRTADRLRAGLAITIDGGPATLTVTRPAVELLPGAGGLQTLRVSFQLEGDLPPSVERAWRIAYRDANYAERAGWKEIVATATGSARLSATNVGAADLSDALRNYPSDPTIAPPQDVGAALTVQAAMSAPSPPTASSSPSFGAAQPRDPLAGVPARQAAQTPRDPFTESISRRSLSTGVVLLSLAMAFLFGALHAVSPGHGKAMVGAYLVGSRGTVRHAALLGAVVTLMHTASVFALGLLALFATRYVLPERIYPAISIASGAAIAVLGLALFIQRIRDYREDREAAPDGLFALPEPPQTGTVGRNERASSKTPDQPATSCQLPTASHQQPATGAAVSLRSLIVLGISGGALPCPSALVVMIGAIALHRIAFGVVLIGAFSMGLAAVLTGLGILVVRMKPLLARLPIGSRAAAALPIASAGAIAAIGVAIVWRAVAGSW